MWVTLALFALTRPADVCMEWSSARAGAAPEVVSAPAAPPPAARPLPPALAQAERAHYRIDYGVLEIGELEVAIAAAVPGATLVHADGHGSGGVLGLGHMDSHIATEFDVQQLESRRWDNARSGREGDLRDRAQQTAAGHVDLVRERPGRAGQRASATLAAPLLDPLGFLLRLRVEPPGARPQILYVLDGQALWRVTIASVGRVEPPENAARVPMMRLDAEADPVHWDGSPATDGDRKHRSFKLWLSDDAARVPVRLEMPVGIADVVVALTQISRS
ncbi:MAG TPA: DUF3108 domain-containing protein [Polyangia bacterium]|jgi:hypothetical protein|nr:DUF3108 domain-containing protein [Polyangia bacterium]